MKKTAAPLLDKPAPHWSHDLPLPDSGDSTRINLCMLSANYVDAIYLEIPCATHRSRGFAIWISLFLGLATVFFLVKRISFALNGNISLIGFIISTSLIIMAVWLSIYMWRMDTEAPKDEPIRFNRARRKVYAYRFYHDGSRPLSKTKWFTRAEVYDWDDIRAEACSIYGPMGSGGLNEAVFLAVVEPGTNKVIDRFLLAHGGRDAEKYWTLARLYMQKGPEALPQFDRPPRDWNNEEIIFNLARYLAPKVEWPEKLDIESRTAPS